MAVTYLPHPGYGTIMQSKGGSLTHFIHVCIPSTHSNGWSIAGVGLSEYLLTNLVLSKKQQPELLILEWCWVSRPEVTMVGQMIIQSIRKYRKTKSPKLKAKSEQLILSMSGKGWTFQGEILMAQGTVKNLWLFLWGWLGIWKKQNWKPVFLHVSEEDGLESVYKRQTIRIDSPFPIENPGGKVVLGWACGSEWCVQASKSLASFEE